MSTTTLAGATNAPRSEYDPYTDAALLDPWPGYRHLRDLGPAVWLPRYEMFALKGAVATSDLERRLSLHGDLHQDLAKLSNAPDKLAARGTANVDLRVESPDLSIFRTMAEVKFENADVRLPGAAAKAQPLDHAHLGSAARILRLGHGLKVVR